MSSLKRSLIAFAFAALAVVGTARAAVITLDFEGAGSQANLNDFYNGGTDSQGNSGTNYGVAFGSNTLALEEGDPIANFALPPSGDTVMFFLTGSAILNYAAGFETGFSFWYTTVNFAGSVQVYDDLDATGNLLGSIDLAALGTGPSPGNPFSNWRIGSLAFSGTAKSINFGGTVNQVGYDDITFGSTRPGEIPEPSTVALMARFVGYCPCTPTDCQPFLVSSLRLLTDVQQDRPCFCCTHLTGCDAVRTSLRNPHTSCHSPLI